MFALVSTFNRFLSLLTILGQIFSICVIILFCTSKVRKENSLKEDKNKKYKKEHDITCVPYMFLTFLKDKAIVLAFFTSLFSSLMSLFYSTVVKFPPCDLCWYQRIFMYPQVFLLGLALYKKDKNIVDYSIVLSLVGFLIAVYHYYGQMFNTSIFPCSATLVSNPCAQRFFVEFSYVTIPMMSATGFLLLLTFMLLRKFYK